MERKQKYLIVDDDADDIDFFCEAVHEIFTDALCSMAHDGEEALRLLRQKSGPLPDFIFLDLNMPRMDGKACLAELKKDDGLKHIPVVICSTSSDPKDKTETLALGADYYLVKAISFKKLCDDILKAVKAVLRKGRFGIL